MESAEGRRDLRPETSTRKHEWNVRIEQENVFWRLIWKNGIQTFLFKWNHTHFLVGEKKKQHTTESDMCGVWITQSESSWNSPVREINNGMLQTEILQIEGS